jgi:predicted porin
MRKFLLTTAAALGAAIGLAGGAYAQGYTATSPATQAPTAAPVPAPVKPPPAPNMMNGIGGGTPPEKTMGQPPMTASSTVVEQGPGSFVVHLNGRLNFYAGVEGDSAQVVGSNKLDNAEFQGYIRLYPGFDAVAANGLQYGVVSEIRNPGSTFTGVGVNASGNSAENTLFWRRAYGYVGTPDLGRLSFGQQDAAFDLLQVGTFENFNDGAWNGDVENFIGGGLGAATGAGVTYPFADVGNIYTVNRLLYMSPNFSGFQFGFSFAPNNNPLINTEGCSVASTTCNRLSSDASATSGTVTGVRYRNIVEAAGNYTSTFGPLGLALYGGFYGGTPINSTAPGAIHYDELAVGAFGATVSYAGFTVGGHINFGDENGLWDLMPQGGKPAFAYMFGGEYTTGPIIVGASWFQYQYTGDFQSAAHGGPTTEGLETDHGAAVGATYAVAPGLALYLSYLYGERHQTGFNFNTGAPNGTAAGGPPGTNNNTHGQVFAVGTVLKW